MTIGAETAEGGHPSFGEVKALLDAVNDHLRQGGAAKKPCKGTTTRGRPCRAQASRWPRGVDGDPQLCGHHLPAPLREARDAGFADEKRLHRDWLAAHNPGCWSWPDVLNWDDVAEYYGGHTSALRQRFDDGEEGALHVAFAAWHNHRCAVCGLRDLHLVKDHDHDSGLIRGLLCRSCNGLEPHNDDLFQKYRERSPARILGIRLRYCDPWNGWAEGS